ncbi:MAG TPA: RecX family transcriptional regulator [Bacteroidales bacterium]|nr:RecX family transcriptional regulator [Bacteroidales bacterium]
MKDDNYSLALGKAMALCSRGEKCIKDIQDKLAAWKLTNEKENQTIIRELVNNSFIDERRYASSYTLDKCRFNKWGRVKIRAMLKIRGIKEKDIEHGLEMIDHDSYVRMIKKEMDIKRKSVKATNLFDLKGKLFRFGASRGYEKEYVYDYTNSLQS